MNTLLLSVLAFFAIAWRKVVSLFVVAAPKLTIGDPIDRLIGAMERQRAEEQTIPGWLYHNLYVPVACWWYANARVVKAMTVLMIFVMIVSIAAYVDTRPVGGTGFASMAKAPKPRCFGFYLPIVLKPEWKGVVLAREYFPHHFPTTPPVQPQPEDPPVPTTVDPEPQPDPVDPDPVDPAPDDTCVFGRFGEPGGHGQNPCAPYNGEGIADNPGPHGDGWITPGKGDK